MRNPKLRRHIAREAAKLMYERVESEYFTAKRKAAARLGVNFKHQPQDLPANREIRDEIQILARLYEGDERVRNLLDMRLAALRMMRLLAAYEPRLIGSVVTGHIRKGSDIDLHVFSDSAAPLCDLLDSRGMPYVVERKRIIKHAEERIFTHIHARDRFEFELTMYPRDKVGYRFKSSITGKAIVRVSIAGLLALLAREHPTTHVPAEEDDAIDRFLLWSTLLAPLEEVKQSPQWHPEGDALYHALQTFELARAEHPYDQEMMTAALLHDVGKAIDAHDHVGTGLEALEGTLTPREEFLIANHMLIKELGSPEEGRRLHSSQKLRRRLEASEWYEDLLVFMDLDRRARKRGVDVCTIDEAIAFLRAIEDG